MFFLCFGEQAPCKSISEAMDLPTRQRDSIISQLSEAYRKQKEEMDKSTRKRSSSNTTSY